MIELNVNVDHVATIRNAREGFDPDPTKAAIDAEKAGAHGIVCHPREDRRHIKDDDVRKIKDAISIKFDLEMALSDDIIKLALEVKPDLVTFVPEKREELTTEGGLDVFKFSEKIKNTNKLMHDNGIQVSLFVEPDIDAINKSKELGADLVELHTGHYANSTNSEEHAMYLKKIQVASDHASSIGLRVAAGHGLNFQNTQDIAKIKSINELSIGHSLISESIFYGLGTVTKRMLDLIQNASK